MPRPRFARRLRRSFFIPKQNHFRIRMQLFPALQRIPLNHSAVPRKWLRRREDRYHCWELYPLIFFATKLTVTTTSDFINVLRQGTTLVVPKMARKYRGFDP